MSLYADHVAYVTEVIREWFSVDHRATLAQWVDEAHRYSIEVQWLADKMHEFAAVALTAAVPHEASRKLLNDALSEVEWELLADEYYQEAS